MPNSGYLMLNDFHISTAVPEDLPALVNLINRAYRGEESKKGWTTEADLLDGIRTDEEALANILGKPGTTILKCCNHLNEIAGCVCLEQKKGKLYLGLLTVSPTMQAKGIGKKLLDVASAFAAQINCPKIEMTVIAVRQELVQWYERHGYCQTGEKRPFPYDDKFSAAKQPLEFIVLEKILHD